VSGLKRLLLMALIGWLGLVSCGGAPPKPGCAPGSGDAIAAECRAAMVAGLAMLGECDDKIDAWAVGCLR
jgi:hypothetical protein